MKPRILLLVTPLLFAGSLYAQNARLSGQLKDTSEAAVPNAVVTALNLETGVKRTSTSNDQGYYSIPSLLPGRYKVSVESPSFQTMIRENITLNVEQDARLDFKLQVGTIEETVTVSGGVPLINTTDGSVSTVVDRQFVENMPLNGRTIQALITLTPGAVLTRPSASGDEGQFSVNGQRSNANYTIIDGVGANIGVNASITGQSVGGTTTGVSAFGSTNNLVSIDALQEFKVLTSTFAPEFGRTPGAQVIIATRSGTNDFHGSVFDYLRNDAMDANDFFNNADRLPKPALRQNDFGGVLGGPIIKNKTFFFFSYEGLRLQLPRTGLTSVPSLNSRAIASASIQPFLKTFPIPNGRDLGSNLAEFNATFSDPSSLDATSIRIDHAVKSNLSLFARYNYSPSSTSQRGASGSRSLNTVTSTALKTQTLTGGMTIAISPSLNNDLRVNYSKNGGKISNSLDAFGGALPAPDSVLFQLQNRSSQDSQFTFAISAATSARFQTGNFGDSEQRQINLVDTLSLTTGAHQLKFGIDYRRLFPSLNFTGYAPSVTFPTVDRVLAGNASSLFIGSFAGKRFPALNNLSLFGQDTWRIRPRLILTCGLRWELDTAPTEKNGNNPFALINVDDPLHLAFAPPGTPLYETQYGNFAPRIGVSYRLFQKQGRETILRGGFGIFYDLAAGEAAAGFGQSFPNSASKSLNSATNPTGIAFPLDAATAASPSFSLTPPFSAIQGAVDPNLELPYSHQWNLTVEQSLDSRQTISASYVGAAGRRLTRQELLSPLNPDFTTVLLTRNGATSDYHAMQLEFQRRLSRGLQVLASYTWSHSLDNVSSDTSLEVPVTRINPQQERGPSDFDVRHAFNLAVTYDVPAPYKNRFAQALLRGFSADTIFRTRSATPVNVLTGGSAAGGSLVSRPDLVPGVPLYVDDPTVAGGRRINKAAFVSPVGRQGTFGRNALRGFSMWQLDFALRREFRLSERLKLQFRVEAFNIFNHPNFGDPSIFSGTSLLTNARFGQSLNMLGRGLAGSVNNQGLNALYQIGGPRSMQLALKLVF